MARRTTIGPGDFVYAVADRYKGRIRAYEVWNEPNLAREWGGRLPDRRVRRAAAPLVRRQQRRTQRHGHQRRPVAHGTME